MSIHESDRTSSLDPGPDGAIGCEDAEVKDPGIGEDREAREELSWAGGGRVRQSRERGGRFG